MEIVKAAPPITVSTVSFFGVALNEWVSIITILYTALLIIFLLRDKLLTPLLKKWKNRKK